MTTRYELRPTANANGNYLDIFIQGAPTSAGCEARVPLRVGSMEHGIEFAEHIVDLLNADGLEQARRANGAQALQDYAARTGLERKAGEQGLVDSGQQDPSSLATNHSSLATDERWQQC